MNPIKVIRDEFGVKLKYPDRSCKTCRRYPCFNGIERCTSNFASFGCKLYSKSKK